MDSNKIRKLALAGVLVAVGVAASPLSIPVGPSRCFPVQHAVNVLMAVLLGPWYGVGAAFATSFIRVLLGTGSLMAFPGSMCGALLCGLMHRYTKSLPLTYLGEVLGTGIIGAMLAYPVALFLMGNPNAALFAYIVPFSVSTIGGTLIAAIIVTSLKKTGILGRLAPMGGETADARRPV